MTCHGIDTSAKKAAITNLWLSYGPFSDGIKYAITLIMDGFNNMDWHKALQYKKKFTSQTAIETRVTLNLLSKQPSYNINSIRTGLFITYFIPTI